MGKKKKKNMVLSFSVTKKDLDIQFFRAGGSGGQHQNKTSSACRIKHRDSGAVGECRNFRSQDKNKREALKRLAATPTFKAWVRLSAALEQSGRVDINTWVDDQMQECNLNVEYL
jgi:protein subunit release factor B